MGEIFSRERVEQAISLAMIEMTPLQSTLLMVAEIFKKSYLAARKIYLINQDPVLFSAGMALNQLLGENLTVQKIERIVFGTLSVISVVEDIHKIYKLGKKCKHIISGKHYIVIKGDRFNIAGSKMSYFPKNFDQLRFNFTQTIERTLLLFKTIGKIFYVFGELVLHLGDIYIAFDEDCSGEVLIHGKNLWEKLTSDQSYLIKQLEENKTLNDWVFSQFDATLSVQIAIHILTLPSKIVNALPKQKDLVKQVSDIVDHMSLNIDLNLQILKNRLQMIWGIDPEMQCDQQFYFYKKGSNKDPETYRFINPPKRIS